MNIAGSLLSYPAPVGQQRPYSQTNRAFLATCEQIHGPLALEYQEVAMTTQFSGNASLPPAGSALVRGLVRARNDPGKDRIRWLIDVDDTQLRSRLGLTQEDIAVLRGAIH